MRSFAGKTVFITGAAGTVGQACIEVFLQGGAQVVATDRIAAPTPREGVQFKVADITDREAIKAVVDAGVRRFGHVDAAILAAGVEGVVAPVEDISEAEIDEVLAVNLKGSLFAMQACLGHMKSAGAGSIVALSSISGVVGSASLGAYTISKHAVVGLVRAAALEAGRYGVRINAVCPGPIDSEMMRRLDRAFVAQDPDRFRGQADAAKGLPMQRYVTAAEVAAMAAFLCSDEAGSCHGGTYMVDGGFTAR